MFATTSEEKKSAASELNVNPTESEILEKWQRIKEKSPGENEVSTIYLKSAPVEFQKRIVNVLHTMFRTTAEHWEDIVKVGLIIPLHKKGAKQKPDNYRGLCLLSIINRILARVPTLRLRNWSENFGALDDNQDGFRQKRSTADTTQIMIRLHEDSQRVE